MNFFNASGYSIGVDEVGRGSMAGEVVACACIIVNKDVDFFTNNIKDSKKMSKKQRNSAIEKLKSCCIYSIASASVEEIEKMNILQASLLAMRRSIDGLMIKIDGRYNISDIIVDGNQRPMQNCKTIVKGDDKYFEISASGIIAKVYRDELMDRYSNDFPEYLFEKNAGYGTKDHRVSVEKHGLCKIHRKSFFKMEKYNNLFSNNS